jgi:hypothetical protein
MPKDDVPPTPAAPAAPATPAATEGTRARFRLTAVSGILAAATLVASYFLPWVVIPPPQAARIEAAYAKPVEDLRAARPDLADGYRMLLEEVRKGRLTGLDVYLFARTSRELNLFLEGVDPRDATDAGSWMVQRSFVLAVVVFAVLPIGSVLAVVLLLLGRFRRVGGPTLVLLIVAGVIGTALTTAWMRFWPAFFGAASVGLGMKVALGASVAQTLVGLLGVTTKTWWRVYVGSLFALGVLGALAWVYLERGASL